MKFYRNNIETSICRFGTFYEKTGNMPKWSFLDTYFEIQLLYGILELVGIRYRIFNEESINSV